MTLFETDFRHLAWVLRRTARQLQPDQRVAMCGCRASGTVAVLDKGGGRGDYRGPLLCERWHSCPTCARVIAAHRAGELRAAAGRWHREHEGGGLYMLTLTIRHHRGQSLRHLLSVLHDAWDAFASGRAWQTWKRELGVKGHVRGIEVKHGRNGWHPHLHVLLFVDESHTHLPLREVDGRMRNALELDAATRWRDITSGYGGGCDASIAVGCKLTPGHCAQYIAKLGWELVSTDTKQGDSRGPFGLLRDATATGDVEAARLWREYATTIKGTRQLTWSRGLKVKPEERTEAEIVDEAARSGRLVMGIDRRVYTALEREGQSLMFADLAVASPGKASRWLIECGFPPAVDASTFEQWEPPRLPEPLQPGEVRHGASLRVTSEARWALVKLWSETIGDASSHAEAVRRECERRAGEDGATLRAAAREVATMRAVMEGGRVPVEASTSHADREGAAAVGETVDAIIATAYAEAPGMVA